MKYLIILTIFPLSAHAASITFDSGCEKIMECEEEVNGVCKSVKITLLQSDDECEMTAKGLSLIDDEDGSE